MEKAGAGPQSHGRISQRNGGWRRGTFGGIAKPVMGSGRDEFADGGIRAQETPPRWAFPAESGIRRSGNILPASRRAQGPKFRWIGGGTIGFGPIELGGEIAGTGAAEHSINSTELFGDCAAKGRDTVDAAVGDSVGGVAVEVRGTDSLTGPGEDASRLVRDVQHANSAIIGSLAIWWPRQVSARSCGRRRSGAVNAGAPRPPVRTQRLRACPDLGWAGRPCIPRRTLRSGSDALEAAGSSLGLPRRSPSTSNGDPP